MLRNTWYIKNAIRRRLSQCAENLETRTMTRCYAGLNLSLVAMEASAYNKAATVVKVVLGKLQATENVRNAALKHIQLLKRVGNKWKGLLTLNKTRKLILRSKWDRMVQILIQQHNTKSKKSTQKKLQRITQTSTNKILDKYYGAQKAKYYKSLAKGVSKLQNRKKSTVTFKYIPDGESLTKMIFEAAGIHLH
eukprot:TRINITY_DN3243_c0_g3_i2.p1 TRINITY_DN3243_c0_g3~~TRINITY_DN3243_c0_g3_i2.p1  ORF type:complete len:193 (-),score=22.11 TRINITY_DN3243_c0_g3_i2:143-721(-)